MAARAPQSSSSSSTSSSTSSTTPRDASQFGIVLVDHPKIKPPTIPGPLFGFGALFQFGPKTYGPSWLNISLFAGLGFNVAIGSNPFLIYGDIYALGHVQVKIAIFKGRLGFAARLYGLATEDFYSFVGEIEVRINLPWPLSDISESFDFEIGDGVPPMPAPVITSTASALGLVEPRSIDLAPGQTQRVPIDSVIAIAFDKPIFEVQAVTAGNTKLTINDPQLPNNAPDPVETITTDVRRPRVSRSSSSTSCATCGSSAGRCCPMGASHLRVRPGSLVGEMAAAWDPPDDVADDGAPEPGSEPHHVLYLNSFAAPELQFSQSALEKHYNWTEGWGTIPPCAIGDRVCLLPSDVLPVPEIDETRMFWGVDFATNHGPARIEERRWHAVNYGGLPRNLNRLAWAEGQLDLPELAAIQLPDADEVELVIRLGAQPPGKPAGAEADGGSGRRQAARPRRRLAAQADRPHRCGEPLQLRAGDRRGRA